MQLQTFPSVLTFSGAIYVEPQRDKYTVYVFKYKLMICIIFPLWTLYGRGSKDGFVMHRLLSYVTYVYMKLWTIKCIEMSMRIWPCGLWFLLNDFLLKFSWKWFSWTSLLVWTVIYHSLRLDCHASFWCMFDFTLLDSCDVSTSRLLCNAISHLLLIPLPDILILLFLHTICNTCFN